MPNDRLFAYNTNKPHFYRVAVDGKASANVFLGDKAKEYFLKCHQLAQNTLLPIELVAYCIFDNTAYMVLASYDQADVSLKRYLKELKLLYMAYYREVFGNTNRVFKDASRIKKVEFENVFGLLQNIHSQPYAKGVARGYDDYKYSSFAKYDNLKYATLSPLEGYLPYNEILAKYNDAHRAAPSRIPFDIFKVADNDRFDLDLEKLLFKYGCKNVKNVAVETLTEIIVELNDLGRYSYGYIVDKLFVKEKNKFCTLVYVVAKMVLDNKLTFDECIAKLNVLVNNEEELLIQVLLEINANKGYSYDVVLNKLGFSYPNINFLVATYKRLNADKGYSYPYITKIFGLHDKEVIERVYYNLQF